MVVEWFFILWCGGMSKVKCVKLCFGYGRIDDFDYVGGCFFFFIGDFYCQCCDIDGFVCEWCKGGVYCFWFDGWQVILYVDYKVGVVLWICFFQCFENVV